MILRGIDYGPAFNASGARGFFGEGYWFHCLGRPFGLDWEGSTFVSKTATFQPREGNMPLTIDYRPRAWWPSCIRIKFLRGLVLNAVGLSGPGLSALLRTGRWNFARPWVLSLALEGQSIGARAGTMVAMGLRLQEASWAMERSGFRRPALEVNCSCPNTETGVLSQEVPELLRCLRCHLDDGWAVLAKVSAAWRHADVLQWADQVDGLVVGNTLPYDFGAIGWASWGREESPLKHLGGGGLSGRDLRLWNGDWLKHLRTRGYRGPVVGVGGILHKADVNYYQSCGANAVGLGSVALLRPWRVRGLIRRAHEVFSG